MGRYVNPGNDGFRQILARRYVDKTGLVSLFDDTLESSEKLVMVSRPRRFGKTFAAQSLVAFTAADATPARSSRDSRYPGTMAGTSTSTSTTCCDST